MAQTQSSGAATRPLQTVYLDHVKIEALVADEHTGEPLGYPWLALAFDGFTRMVTGFHLSMSPPSRVSASLSLLHSVCDKGRWMMERGLEGVWPAAGLPEAVVADADGFFGLRGFMRACQDQGVATRSSRKGAYGAFAEEFLGARFGELPIVYGGGDDLVERKMRRMGVGDTQTLPELERRLGEEIIAAYHQRRHDDLDVAPLDAWIENAARTSFRAPHDCLKFRLSFFPEQQCDLQVDGIHVAGHTFWSQALKADIEAGVDSLVVKFDPRDYSRVFVRRDSGRYIKVKNTQWKRAISQDNGSCGATPDDVAADGAEVKGCRTKCHSSCPFAPRI